MDASYNPPNPKAESDRNAPAPPVLTERRTVAWTEDAPVTFATLLTELGQAAAFGEGGETGALDPAEFEHLLAEIPERAVLAESSSRPAALPLATAVTVSEDTSVAAITESVAHQIDSAIRSRLDQTFAEIGHLEARRLWLIEEIGRLEQLLAERRSNGTISTDSDSVAGAAETGGGAPSRRNSVARVVPASELPASSGVRPAKRRPPTAEVLLRPEVPPELVRRLELALAVTAGITRRLTWSSPRTGTIIAIDIPDGADPAELLRTVPGVVSVTTWETGGSVPSFQIELNPAERTAG